MSIQKRKKYFLRLFILKKICREEQCDIHTALYKSNNDIDNNKTKTKKQGNNNQLHKDV